jgi:hypothetical protein
MIGLFVAAVAVALVSFGFSAFSHAPPQEISVALVIGLASFSVAVAAAIATWQIHKETTTLKPDHVRWAVLHRWRQRGH